jgi:hypothetical protein
MAILTVFVSPSTVPPGKYLTVAQLGHSRLLPNPFRFTIHQSSYAILIASFKNHRKNNRPGVSCIFLQTAITVVGWFAGRKSKVTMSGISNPLYSCVIFKLYIIFKCGRRLDTSAIDPCCKSPFPEYTEFVKRETLIKINFCDDGYKLP